MKVYVVLVPASDGEYSVYNIYNTKEKAVFMAELLYPIYGDYRIEQREVSE